MGENIIKLNNSTKIDNLIFKTLGTKVDDNLNVSTKVLDRETVIKAINNGSNINSLSFQSYNNLIRNVLLKYINDEELSNIVHENIIKVLKREESK